MATLSERLEFAPPTPPGLVRALILAVAVHGVLLMVLASGVSWKRDVSTPAVEAELWSAIPVEAAPPAPPTPEQPVAPPEPVKPPEPPPTEPVKAPPPKPATPAPNADIALAKEKAKLQKEKQLLLEKLEQEKQKLARAEQDKRDAAAKEKEARDKQQLDLRTAQAKTADAALLKSAKRAADDARKLEELRQQNLQRMAGLAGGAVGNGDANSSGSAAQASGPSAGYAGRIRARIKPNITFTDTITGNPLAEVEVRTSPDGTIINRRLTKPSGVKSWDDAVLNAIDKTEVLPRDTDGRVPTSLVISFRPKD
jgi:colicin import membrane protein